MLLLSQTTQSRGESAVVRLHARRVRLKTPVANQPVLRLGFQVRGTLLSLKETPLMLRVEYKPVASAYFSFFGVLTDMHGMLFYGLLAGRGAGVLLREGEKGVK